MTTDEMTLIWLSEIWWGLIGLALSVIIYSYYSKKKGGK